MHPLEVLLTILLTPLGWLFRGRHADESASLANAPELAATGRLTVTSPSFGDGETIPAKHCGKFIGTNVSPALRWSALPQGTTELLLLIEDLDSPGKTPRLHTVAAFAPSTGGLAEGALTAGAPGIRFLPRNGGYVGPRPLPGHGPHRYRFHLYALDSQADLARVSSASKLPALLKGHVLASGTLNGTRKA